MGVKAEVEKTVLSTDALDLRQLQEQEQPDEYGDEDAGEGREGSHAAAGQSSWVQMSIEIPGFRDDDALPVFLSEMMRESLVGSSSGAGSDGDKGMVGGLKRRLVINRRWHWRLYIDVCIYFLFTTSLAFFLFLLRVQNAADIYPRRSFSYLRRFPILYLCFPSPPISRCSPQSYQNSNLRVRKIHSSRTTGPRRNIFTRAPTRKFRLQYLIPSRPVLR